MFVLSSACSDRQRTVSETNERPHGEPMVSIRAAGSPRASRRIVSCATVELEVIGAAELDTDGIVVPDGHDPTRYVLRAAIAQYKAIGAKAFDRSWQASSPLCSRAPGRRTSSSPFAITLA